MMVDIVMCIDATGSMTPTLDAVKANALLFDQNLKDAIQRRGRQIDSIRVRPVYFRDFDSEGENAMQREHFWICLRNERRSNLSSMLNPHRGVVICPKPAWSVFTRR